MGLETAFEVGRLFLPLKTIADLMSLAQYDTFIRLPGLRGYWPMSIVNTTGAAVDHSHASADLSRTGAPLFGTDANAYVQLGVATDFLFNSTSVFNITGTEAWIDSDIQGLTFGGWYKIDNTPGSNAGLIGKDGAPTNRGFALYWTPDNKPAFILSGNGTTTVQIVHTSQLLNTWYFIVGRLTPSSELAIFVNGDKAANTTSIPASVNVSNQNFEIGRHYNSNSRIIEGKARDVFICVAALPDATLSALYNASMPA